MIDSFFNYFREDRRSISQDIYKGTGQHSECKEYARFPRVILPTPQKIDISFSDILKKRKSTRSFLGQPLTLPEISTLLFWSVGIKEERLEDGTARRMCPSGGAKFPIECYPLILYDGEIKKGIYHYNVCAHALEEIARGETINTDTLEHYFYYPFVRDAGVVLLFSFIKERSMPKYGSLAYKLGFLEAGHIGQNVYLATTALNLGCCSLGSQEEKSLHALLGLDGLNESLCYAIAIGRWKEDN